MAAEMIKLVSKEGEEFDFKMAHLEKAVMLKQMLCDLGFEEGSVPSESVPLPSIGTDALRTIVAWLVAHEEVKPRSEEERQIHRFNRHVARVDTELFEALGSRSKLADVINAAYYLEMPDLIDALIKYTANNLEGKNATEMSTWLDISLKKEGRKTPADDGEAEEGESAEKRERAE